MAVMHETDGSTSWMEYAVVRPAGGTVGPMSRGEAERLAAEIGGTVMSRRITHGAWSAAVSHV